LVGEVGEAIVRYLTEVRTIALRRPHRPLSGGGLSTQVRVA